MNLVTIGMFSRAAAVRSPILSYGHTRPKHVSPLRPSLLKLWHPTEFAMQAFFLEFGESSSVADNSLAQ
ncbi:hypothetical protein Tsubulata_007262 [Turnera subulata]|uniref:Uncharacterized protein n=1 Tax=Turnera subulata TaxID=218843 RepID=A0A9Q0GFR5_9ROSI|nr:hypothetical protein Tsubulata_007262 [Turnera subulata]